MSWTGGWFWLVALPGKTAIRLIARQIFFEIKGLSA
jgi:hypothetical protein